MPPRASPRLVRVVPPERLFGWPAPLRRRHEVRALAYVVAQATGGLERLPADERAPARQAYLGTVAQNLARLSRLDVLTRAAETAGVTLVAWKGAALAGYAYGDEGARPMVDVDVLCAPAELARAVEIGRAAGFTVATPPAFRQRSGAVHDVKLVDGAVTIELHHRLWHELGLSGDARRLLERSQRVEHDGRRLRVPAPDDHLVAVMIHAALHGFAGNPLWITDALLLADELGPHAFDDLVERAPPGGRVALAAAHDQLARLCPDRVPATGGPARLRRRMVGALAPWLWRGEPELGLWPSRLVRPLLVDGAPALGRWALGKARLFAGRRGERDW